MRVLILGGTGFVGPHVVRRLAALGHRVVVAHTGAHEVELPAEVEHLHHPALTVGRPDLTALADVFERLRPEVVLAMALMTEADARDSVRAFRGIACRLVVISSQDVYRAYGVLHRTEPGPPEPIPLTEDAPLRQQLYPYRGVTPRAADDPRRWFDDYDKILVERVVTSEPALPGTVLRLPAVYGPGDGQRRLFPYLKRMDDGRPAILLGASFATWRWTRGYVENVAHAIALAVGDERASGRIYNVADPVAFSEAEWVRAIGRSAGWSGDVVLVPDADIPAPLRLEVDPAQDLVVDTTRIRSELGYAEAVSPEEALRRTIAWERATPPPVDPRAFDYAAEDAALAR